LAGNCRAIAAAIVLDLGEAPPNRGVANQPDISLYGLHYHQRVSDADPPPFSTAGPSAAHRAGPVHERAGQPG
jgi:hypothetical protein